MVKENKLEKVRRVGRLKRLIKELDSKNGIEKEDKKIIMSWINSAYEIGLKDAGDIIGRNIVKMVDKELRKLDAKDEGGESR